LLFNLQNKEKNTYLKWFDILVLTLILWGEGIYTSTISYIALIQGKATIDDNLSFSATDNYGSLALQAGLLLLALLYLWLRRFDFKAWTIRFNIKAVASGVLIFLAAALLLDIYFLLTNPLTGVLPFPGPIGAFFVNETVSSVLYALLNGVYEEIYFLGICLAVRKEHLKWAVPFSLLIRISFHTYQGILSALGIGLLFGIFMYLLYRRSKDRNLLPFFIAHAIGDIFGLGILSYFWM
jgi:hypothetical protein